MWYNIMTGPWLPWLPWHNHGHTSQVSYKWKQQSQAPLQVDKREITGTRHQSRPHSGCLLITGVFSHCVTTWKQAILSTSGRSFIMPYGQVAPGESASIDKYFWNTRIYKYIWVFNEYRQFLDWWCSRSSIVWCLDEGRRSSAMLLISRE